MNAEIKKGTLIRKIVPIVLFALVFSLYIYTDPKVSTNFADSNELIAASYTLGVPHAPGYPIFMIVGKIFSFIPIGGIAFRYSIMASFLGAMTILFVYLGLVKLSDSENEGSQNLILTVVPAIMAAFSLAFAYLFWLYSLVPEVFNFSNFFTALLVYVGICWYKQKKDKTLAWKNEDRFPFLIALLAGLAVVSQQVTFFLIPPFLFAAFILDRSIFKPSRRWLKVVSGFLLGLLPIIYLPLASMTNPIIDYGNTTTLNNLWYHLSRKIYSGGTGNAYFQTKLDLGLRISELLNYLPTLVDQFTVPIVCIGLLGFISVVLIFIRKEFRDPKIFVALIFLFGGPLICMYLALNRKNFPGYNVMAAQDRVFLMGIVLFAFLIGIGADFLLKAVKKSKYFSLPIVALLIFVFPVLTFRYNFPSANKNDFYLGEDYAYNLFLNIKQDAIFFTTGDMPSFAAYYYRYVKGQRKDVTIIPFSLRSWSIERLHQQEPDLWDTDSKIPVLIFKDIIKKNIDKRPIYFTGIPTDRMLELGVGDNPYVLTPRGLITQAGKDFDFREGDDYWGNMRWQNPENISTYRDWYSKELFEQYIVGRYNSFSHYLIRGYYDLAEKELTAMQQLDPYHGSVEDAAYKWRVFGKKQREVKPFKLKTEGEYTNLAYKALQENRFGVAAAYYSLLKGLDPKNISYAINLGKVYEALGWLPDAYKEYKKALEINPQDNDAKEKVMLTEEKLKSFEQPVF